MTAPNLAALTSITGTTTNYTPGVNTAVILLPNPAGSNTVLKINSLAVANVDGTNPFNATVAYYTNGAVAQGSAPSGGTAFALASTIAIPANASLIVIDKTTQIYLPEGTSLSITSSTASKLVFTASYEIIS